MIVRYPSHSADCLVIKNPKLGAAGLLHRFRNQVAILTLAATVASISQGALGATVTDNFTDATKWKPLISTSSGTKLSVANGRMNYVTNSADNSGAVVEWRGTKLPVNQNWSIAIDAHINEFELAEFVDLFLGIYRTADSNNIGSSTNIAMEFQYSSVWNYPPYVINEDIKVNGEEVYGNGIYDGGGTSPDISMRMDYNASNRTITYYIDSDGATGGYSWENSGTLEVGPTMDQLGIASSETFTIFLVGSSEGQTVASGAATLSNLRVTTAGTTAGSQTINFAALPDKRCGDVDFAPGATASSGLAVTYVSSNPAVATIVSGKIHITGPGTTTITAKQAGNTSWEPAPDVSQELNVSKGTPVITWSNPAAIYYGTALGTTQLNAKANVAGVMVYSPAAGVKLPVGEQTLSVTFTPTDATRYNTATKTVTLMVNKPAATITLAGLSQVYNGQPRPVTATTVPAGLNVNMTYNGSSNIPANAGSYAVVATVDDPNASGTKTGTLTITKGTQTITFPTLPTLRNGDADYPLMATASSGLPVSYVSSAPAVATIVDGNKLHIVGGGSVTITASQPGDSNWNAARSVAKVASIGKRSQTLDFPALANRTMGDADFDPGATASSGLAVTYTSSAPTVATIVNGKIHLVGKGTAVITASQAGNTGWAAAVTVTQTLNVAPGTQTINFPPLPDKGYGDLDFAPGATAGSGLAITYTSSVSTVATIVAGKIHITGIGTSTITANQAGNTSWAAAAPVTQILTVTKGTPVITWANPAAITYGTALTTSQLNAKANVVGQFVYTPALGVKLPVGAQPLNVVFTPTDATKYNPATKTVTLMVNKPAATITLVGLNQTYNGQPRLVTATTVPAGLNVSITYNGSTTPPANAGSYPVVASVDDPNASGTKTGTLIIGKGNQTINFASLAAMHVGDADRVLTASAASGLPVSYTSSNANLATIVDGNKVHAVAAGTVYITATQPGDANWNPALAAKVLLTVQAAPPTPTPEGFALIPAGSFKMGNALSASGDGESDEDLHTVQVSAFYMAKYEVTKELWDSVQVWGGDNGYTDLPTPGWWILAEKANHPMDSVSWYDVIKWCNARSEKDGLTPCYTVAGSIYRTGENDAVVCNWSANGYRLPTESEWEKAARGGLIGKRFPWGDTINHTYANYWNSDYFYESPQNQGFHPAYDIEVPYTAPVGSFSANGYGLYDMAGNMGEWCWDWHADYPYTSQTDPRGPASAFCRVFRGGSWCDDAWGCRVAVRHGYVDPPDRDSTIGFRVVRSSAR